jgi:hypothetical protein
MKGLRLGLALLAIPLALAACGGGGGSKSGAPPATTSTTTTTSAPKQVKAVTIAVTSVVTGRTSTDKPPKGASVGDQIHFTDRLLNRRAQFGKKANAPVGTDKGTLTVTGAHTARLDGEAKLPDGTIMFSGPMTPVANNSVTVPVVGGTGKYKNATGVLVVGAGLTRALNVFRLELGGATGPVA